MPVRLLMKNSTSRAARRAVGQVQHAVADVATSRRPSAAAAGADGARKAAIRRSPGADVRHGDARAAPGATATRSTRSLPAACAMPTCGPPYGQPLPSVRSTRRPSSRAFAAAKRTSSRKASERNGCVTMPVAGVVERERVDRLDLERRRCRRPS